MPPSVPAAYLITFDGRRFTISGFHNNQPIRYPTPLNVVITFAANFRSRYQDRVEFVFEDRSLQQRFVIIRDVRGIAGEEADHEMLRPKEEYKPKKWQPRAQETSVVRGVRPPALHAIPWVVPLPEAPIPRLLADAVSSGSVEEILARLKTSFLPTVLNSDTYGRHFKQLLWVEEARMQYVVAVLSVVGLCADLS
jgi:helicase MOV-10